MMRVRYQLSDEYSLAHIRHLKWPRFPAWATNVVVIIEVFGDVQ